MIAPRLRRTRDSTACVIDARLGESRTQTFLASRVLWRRYLGNTVAECSYIDGGYNPDPKRYLATIKEAIS